MAMTLWRRSVSLHEWVFNFDLLSSIIEFTFKAKSYLFLDLGKIQQSCGGTMIRQASRCTLWISNITVVWSTYVHRTIQPYDIKGFTIAPYSNKTMTGLSPQFWCTAGAQNVEPQLSDETFSLYLQTMIASFWSRTIPRHLISSIESIACTPLRSEGLAWAFPLFL